MEYLIYLFVAIVLYRMFTKPQHARLVWMDRDHPMWSFETRGMSTWWSADQKSFASPQEARQALWERHQMVPSSPSVYEDMGWDSSISGV